MRCDWNGLNRKGIRRIRKQILPKAVAAGIFCVLLAGCGKDITNPKYDETVSDMGTSDATEGEEDGGISEADARSDETNTIPARLYITRWDEIPDAEYNAICELAATEVEAEETRNEAFNNEAYRISYSDNELMASVLLAADETTGIDFSASSRNGIGFLFHALRLETYPDYPDLGQEKDVCYLVRFRNFYLNEEGNLSYDSDIDAVEYESYDQAWRSYVEKNADRYLAYLYEGPYDQEDGN